MTLLNPESDGLTPGESLLLIAASHLLLLYIVLRALRSHPRWLLVFVLVSTAAAAAQVLVVRQDFSWKALTGLLKMLCEWPLGVGSLLTFSQLLSPGAQLRCMPAMTSYINVAVLVNIGMMAFVPAGGTVRGMSHKAVCLLLLVWLLKEVRCVGWFNTVRFRPRDGAFHFTASPLPWILAHAPYRVVMMSLPMFESMRYVLMEPVSLGVMLYLARRDADVTVPVPVCHWFGLADTLAISTSTVLNDAAPAVWAWATSRTLSLTLRTTMTPEQVAALDVLGVCVHVVVGGIALWHVVARQPLSPAHAPTR